MVPMTEYFSVRRRKLHLGLLSDLKRFPLTMPFSLARKVVRIDEEVDELPKKMVDHDYVEYNNSSITSSCQAHSPWLSA
ncbi:BnaC06g07790D [Brassica napus]|uniref:BnaC06g07790D protein n=1 Tax=Brassica napus TaxID=3708 RepID=A0A078FSL2_BRANA|nr:BnaC06g07790D [Brassica napus]